MALRTLVCCAMFVAWLGFAAAGRSTAGPFNRAADQHIQAALSGYHAASLWVAGLVQPAALALLTGAMVVLCLAARRPRGAVLAVLGVAAATALTEFALKPLVGETLHGVLVYPSGHSTRAFALAAAAVTVLLGPGRHRLPFGARLAVAAAVLLAACAVAVAVVALDYHYFADAAAGAAVGGGTVAGVALAIDWTWPRLSRHRPDRAGDGTESVNGNTLIGKKAMN